MRPGEPPRDDDHPEVEELPAEVAQRDARRLPDGPRTPTVDISQFIYRQGDLTGSARRARDRALPRLFEALARGRPLIVVVDDLHWCDQSKLDLPFLHEFKLAGSYMLPWYGIQANVALQSYNGQPLFTRWNISPTTRYAANCVGACRPGELVIPNQTLATYTVDLVALGQQYYERQNQLDMGFRKIFRVGRYQLSGQVDFFNIVNSSYVKSQNITIGTSLGQPLDILAVLNDAFFEKYLGMRVEQIDMTELTRRIDEGIFDEEEYRKALEWTRANCKEGDDRNAPDMQRTREQKDRDWETSVKMAIIARDLMVGNPRLAELGFGEEALGHNAIAGGFQGQRQWTDHFPNGDFMEAILNSSFDWNGIRAPFVFATENDALNAATMLFGHLLTNTAQIFADVRTYWSPDAIKRVTGYTLEGRAQSGILHLSNSGAATLDATGEMLRDNQPSMKPFWEITEDDVRKSLQATTWGPAVTGYFRGGGFSSTFTSRGGMPVTMSRINIVEGFGPVLQLAEGWTVDLPPEVHKTLVDRTDPTWPTHWFAPRIMGNGPFRDAYSVMANWGANHGAISYGHIGSDLITLASMLRIPVSMHNVPAEALFRPSAWSAFGTADPEGADYRACTNFGPLYGEY